MKPDRKVWEHLKKCEDCCIGFRCKKYMALKRAVTKTKKEPEPEK